MLVAVPARSPTHPALAVCESSTCTGRLTGWSPRIRQALGPLGPSEGQISRFKNENAKQSPPGAANSEIGDLTDLRTTALARLAAQHEEITRLRNLTRTNPRSNIARLPGPKEKIIGPC